MFPRKQFNASGGQAVNGQTPSLVNQSYTHYKQNSTFNGNASNTSNMFLVLGQRKVLLESPTQQHQGPAMR